MAKKDIKERDARQCIEDIFFNTPSSRAELGVRLDSVDAVTMRRLLVDELDKGNIGTDEGFMFVEAMVQLGAGHQKRRLMKIASDASRPKSERAYAFMALGPDNLIGKEIDLPDVGADLVEEMMAFSLRNLFMMGEEDIGPAVADILQGLPGDDFAEFFLEKMEEQRVQARVPAYIAYEHALQDEALSAYHEGMTAAIEQEGNALGIALLQKLGSQSKERSTQKGFHKAAMKARTKMADTDPGSARQTEKGFALVSCCDGQGAISIVATLENKDGSTSLANLCLRTEREIRDGFYLPNAPEDVFDSIIEQQQLANVEFVRVSLEEAAALVHSALEPHTKNNLPLDLDAQRAIACFPPSSVSLDVELDDKALLGQSFSVEDYEDILNYPEYDSWFFDSADFEQCGVTPPVEIDFDTDQQEEIDAAVRKLNKPNIKGRLLAMNRYMAWWAKLKGDEELVAMHLQAGKTMTEDFANSPFVEAMVAQSFFVAEMMQEEYEDEERPLLVGDAVLRRSLRATFFSDIKVPTGRDMAALDYTEAAHLAFEYLFEKLPGDQRPRPNILPLVSYRVGKVIVESLQKKLTGTADKLLAKVALAITSTSGLDKSTSEQLAIAAVGTIFDFTETVCKQCAVACLQHPKQRMPDEFFSDEHPGAH